MYPSRRTVLSYLAALGTVGSKPVLGKAIASETRLTTEDDRDRHD